MVTNPDPKSPMWASCFAGREWACNVLCWLWLEWVLESDEDSFERTKRLDIEVARPALLEQFEHLFVDLKVKPVPTGWPIELLMEEFRPRLGAAIKRRPIQPLGPGWPTDPTDISYMHSLTVLGKAYSYNGYSIGEDAHLPGWTREEIKVALELRELLQLPPSSGGSRIPWYLPDPINGSTRIPGEWAVIKELVIRRSLEETGLEICNDDVFWLLAEAPWHGEKARRLNEAPVEFSSPEWFPVMWDGLVGPSLRQLNSALHILAYELDGRGLTRDVITAYKSLMEMLRSLAPIDDLEKGYRGGVVEIELPFNHVWSRCAEAKEFCDYLLDHYLDLDAAFGPNNTVRELLESEDWDTLAAGERLLTKTELAQIMKKGHIRRAPPEPYGYSYGPGLGVYCNSCSKKSLDYVARSPYMAAPRFYVEVESFGPREAAVVKEIKTIPWLILVHPDWIPSVPALLTWVNSLENAVLLKSRLEGFGATVSVAIDDNRYRDDIGGYHPMSHPGKRSIWLGARPSAEGPLSTPGRHQPSDC